MIVIVHIAIKVSKIHEMKRVSQTQPIFDTIKYENNCYHTTNFTEAYFRHRLQSSQQGKAFYQLVLDYLYS